jgi:Zn finger protein HypA/HybF involved in hydrogenase expression
MHELSLAIEIGRLAEEKLGPDVSRCRAVGVEVGTESGIEPSALEFCLEAVFSHPPFCGVRPVLERPPGDIFQVTWFEVEDDDGSAD